MAEKEKQDELLETLDAISLLSKCLAEKLKKKTKQENNKEKNEDE